MNLLRYLKNRLDERSTWMLMSAGIAGAAALSQPWSYVSAAMGVIAALVPDGAMSN